MLDNCNGPEKFVGTIAILSGDNPGSSAVGSFIDGSTAFKPCRKCMGTIDSMGTEVRIVDCTCTCTCILLAIYALVLL